jgi:hypothetical protein
MFGTPATIQTGSTLKYMLLQDYYHTRYCTSDGHLHLDYIRRSFRGRCSDLERLIHEPIPHCCPGGGLQAEALEARTALSMDPSVGLMLPHK